MKALLDWFDREKRDLPWRASADPYRVWLSEIMLQQTRVETVRAYFERFTKRWPTIVALAGASLDDVLAEWSGLGYYARARNLHAAARRVRDVHAGIFPRDPDAVRALPGVGEYTAGAILSIAFGRREAVVDGNVIRVLARVRALPGSPKDASLKSECWRIARELVPADRPGDFNQALMELGAMVCVPANPRCEVCPLARSCEARASGRTSEIPAKAPKRARPHRVVRCAFVRRNASVLLVRRPDEGLLGGLWEMPELATLPAARVGEEVARVEHAFTHFDLTLVAHACEAAGELPGKLVAVEDLGSYGIGAATRRALETALSGRPRGKSTATRSRQAARRPRRPRTRAGRGPASPHRR